MAQNISVARAAQEAGAELVLLAYPANFYARTSQDIYDYTKAFCDQVDIGVILFPVPLWGFERIHPAGMEIDLLRKLVDDVPNIVAIKAEGGMPTIGGFVETYKTLGKRVIVTSPLEWDGIPLASLVPIQFMGTSNYEFYGPTIPKMFALTQEGEFAEAMKLFWKIHPARLANLQAMSCWPAPTFSIECSGNIRAGCKASMAARCGSPRCAWWIGKCGRCAPPSTNADSTRGPSRTAIFLSAVTQPETSIACCC